MAPITSRPRGRSSPKPAKTPGESRRRDNPFGFKTARYYAANPSELDPYWARSKRIYRSHRPLEPFKKEDAAFEKDFTKLCARIREIYLKQLRRSIAAKDAAKKKRRKK